MTVTAPVIRGEISFAVASVGFGLFRPGFTSGASLAQFKGFRYLKYKALMTTSDSGAAGGWRCSAWSCC